MRNYQVTRKMQVTIPKKIAQKKGINPGDSVTFEASAEGILIHKVGSRKPDPRELRSVIENFVNDVVQVRPHIRKARKALNENLSRNISAK